MPAACAASEIARSGSTRPFAQSTCEIATSLVRGPISDVTASSGSAACSASATRTTTPYRRSSDAERLEQARMLVVGRDDLVAPLERHAAEHEVDAAARRVRERDALGRARHRLAEPGARGVADGHELGEPSRADAARVSTDSMRARIASAARVGSGPHVPALR